MPDHEILQAILHEVKEQRREIREMLQEHNRPSEKTVPSNDAIESLRIDVDYLIKNQAKQELILNRLYKMSMELPLQKEG
ncbi:hypothetical protein JOC95_001758 [Bacillus tianshenii]|uniref:Uncharacterized protein n=1 Tax=Sutcliffiella tianshenii TaxID=1463404 RepID=A0ABS2NYZ1_9BACI|nr:hypothetical protein [Bacillus tianshenii]